MYDEGLVDYPHRPTDVKRASDAIMPPLLLPHASEYLANVLTVVVFVSQ